MILKGKIRGGRTVILRPLKLEESEIYRRWFNDPEVTKYHVNPSSPATKKEEIEITKRLSASPNNFAIEAEGKPIGACGVGRKGFGITVGEKEYWGKGYGTAVARLLIDYGFEKLGLEQISADAMEFNLRSIRMIKRAGCQEVNRDEKARWREVIFEDGRREAKFWDILHFTITKAEWAKNR